MCVLRLGVSDSGCVCLPPSTQSFRMPGLNIVALFALTSSFDTSHYPETQRSLVWGLRA